MHISAVATATGVVPGPATPPPSPPPSPPRSIIFEIFFLYTSKWFNGHLQSWTKYLTKVGKSSNIGQERKNLIDICFCVFFDCFSQSLTSGRKTGHWAMSSPKFEIFPIFSNFLRSLSRSVTREATRIPSLLH